MDYNKIRTIISLFLELSEEEKQEAGKQMKLAAEKEMPAMPEKGLNIDRCVS